MLSRNTNKDFVILDKKLMRIRGCFTRLKGIMCQVYFYPI